MTVPPVPNAVSQHSLSGETRQREVAVAAKRRRQTGVTRDDEAAVRLNQRGPRSVGARAEADARLAAVPKLASGTPSRSNRAIAKSSVDPTCVKPTTTILSSGWMVMP